MEQLYLDPDSVDLTGDKDYTSVDELREDLLDLPIYFDWVAWRIPANLFNVQSKNVSLTWIDITLIAAIQISVCERINNYMKRLWTSY